MGDPITGTMSRRTGIVRIGSPNGCCQPYVFYRHDSDVCAQLLAGCTRIATACRKPQCPPWCAGHLEPSLPSRARGGGCPTGAQKKEDPKALLNCGPVLPPDQAMCSIRSCGGCPDRSCWSCRDAGKRRRRKCASTERTCLPPDRSCTSCPAGCGCHGSRQPWP